MKKILCVAIGILCLTGCWTEEHTYRPKKTGYANRLFREVQEELLQTVAYLDAARKTDLWCAAPEGAEKEKIEDTYFARYKVRQHSDTISLVTLGGEPGTRFVTGGKRLTELGAQWKIIRHVDTLIVNNQENNRWSISLLCHPMLPGQMNLVISKNEKESYQIAGNGITRKGYISVIPVAYQIEKPIAAQPFLEQVSLFSGMGVNTSFFDGEISFEANELSGTDLGKAVILQGQQYTITYKGFTENWALYGY